MRRASSSDAKRSHKFSCYPRQKVEQIVYEYQP